MTWSQIDERLQETATPGLRVWFTEMPDTQNRGVAKPNETMTRIDYRPASASLTVWDGTLTVHLTGPTGPRTVTVHARCVPGAGEWRLDAWDVVQ